MKTTKFFLVTLYAPEIMKDYREGTNLRHSFSGQTRRHKASRNWFFFFLALFLCAFVVIPHPVYAALKKPAEQRARQLSAARTRYEISIEIDPGSLSYKGHQKVLFQNQQNRSTNYLLFFVYPNDPALTKADKKFMTISHVTVDGSAAKVDENGSFLRIYLEKDLTPGTSLSVEMDFDAVVPAQRGNPDMFSQTMDELLKILDTKSQSEVDYGIFSSGKDIVNLGFWYPVLSKYDRTGWDEERYAGIGDVSYFDPADFFVNLIVPAQYNPVTSGTVLKQIPRKDGKMEYQISSVLSRDFEVELSERFQELDRIENATTIRSHFLPDHKESGAAALEAGVKAFEYFETTFGAYPYTELDIVEAPLFGGAGGVEFPGLVTISSMLYKEPSGPSENDLLKNMIAGNPIFDQLLEFVVAHEVAHQWWNAVVGSNSKQHPFLDEAMANYSAILYFEHYYGREAAEKQMALQMKVNYQLHRMLGGDDRPVLLPASSFQGPLEYSAIIYAKGALYFDHLRQLLGDRIFYAAMRSYYDAFWFRIAEPEDFKRIAMKKAPEKSREIDALYQRWLLGHHGDEDIGPGTMDAVLRTVLSSDQSISTEKLEEVLQDLDALLKQ